MKTRWFESISLAVILILALTGKAAAQSGGPADPGREDPVVPSASGAVRQRAADGAWFMPASLQGEVRAAAPAGSGGPDDFGYTWNDTISPSWIDAGGGTDPGLGSYEYAGPIDIGFPFKYYENVRNQLFISRYGVVAFNADNLSDWQSTIPNPSKPNDVIAPHWVIVNSIAGYVRYLRGGTAPNRWFAVEWNRVRSDCCSGDGAEEYTFEAILHESGDIVFQYGAMVQNGGYYCQSSGIEDAAGLDGLSITPFCNSVASNHAVRIYRPAPAARVALSPKTSGAFGAPGAAVSFSQVIRNIGELGADTYDLFPPTGWALFGPNGVTPLADTDGDGAPDTGAIGPGASATVVVKVAVPAGATLGNYQAASIPVRSSRDPTRQKLAAFQAAVPAPFVQSYTQGGWPQAGFFQPNGQTFRQTSASSAYNPAVATTPSGQIVQVWTGGSYRNGNGRYVSELYYALLDNRGNVIRPATKLTDHGGATTNAYDNVPSVAVTPDGRIGIAWYGYLYDNNNSNYNIYYLVLDSAGAMLGGPTSLTENGDWGPSSSAVPRFWNPAIAATPDNRFVVTWYRYIYDGSSTFYTVWYAVRDSGGGAVRGRTQLSDHTRSYSPNLATLADGTVLLSHQMDNEIAVSRLDSAGNRLGGPTKIAGSRGYGPDAVQMSNGNIAVAWTKSETLNAIQYAILGADLGAVKGPAALPTMSPAGDDHVSVTRAGGRAMLTWGSAWDNPNLYYTLLDGSGNIVTPPMIFAGDLTSHSLLVTYNGYGNTELRTPPKSAARSPRYAAGAIPVTWSGTDAGSGITNYDIWVRAGPAGAWTQWLAATTATGANYAGGIAGQTYYFRSVAHDLAGNAETDLPADGDTLTTVAATQVTGRVSNNRDGPIFNATVNATPAMLNTPATTDGNGGYGLFDASTGVYALTASRAGYGALPARNGVDIAGTSTDLDFVLPPAEEIVVNGGWETGGLTGWQVGAEAIATVEAAAAHTGLGGLRLISPLASGPEPLWQITQTVSLPAGIIEPTLSWLTRVVSGDGAESLLVEVSNGSTTITHTVPLAPVGWMHAWKDLSAFSGQAVTLRIGFQGTTAAREVHLDEISIGATRIGSYSVYLPLVVRQ